MTEEVFVPIHDTVRMDWFLFDGEVAAENRMHFKHQGGAYTDMEGFEVADMVFSFCEASIMPLLSMDTALQFVIGFQLEVPFGAVYDVHPPDPIDGGMGIGMPACLAARVDFRTGLDGKWYNGRNYLPWIPRDYVLKSHIDPEWLESVRSAYEGMIALANTHGWDWVVPSRRLGGLPRTEGITTPITEVAIPDNRIHTWRQRLPRFGT